MTRVEKMLVFDMDGTIADFYGVEGWLDYLDQSDTTPYEVAEPLYNMEILVDILTQLQELGYRIAVTSWLAKQATKEYDRAVRKAKKEWLAKYNFPYDEIHLVKYGTQKSKCTKNKADFQILFDDNCGVRNTWKNGATVDATKNILEVLEKMLANEKQM